MRKRSSPTSSLRVAVLCGKGLGRKQLDSAAWRNIEAISCYEETFDGDPEQAARWMNGSVKAILVTTDDFGQRVLPHLLRRTSLPIIVVGEGRSEGNVMCTGTCLPVRDIPDIVSKVISHRAQIR